MVAALFLKASSICSITRDLPSPSCVSVVASTPKRSYITYSTFKTGVLLRTCIDYSFVNLLQSRLAIVAHLQPFSVTSSIITTTATTTSGSRLLFRVVRVSRAMCLAWQRCVTSLCTAVLAACDVKTEVCVARLFDLALDLFLSNT